MVAVYSKHIMLVGGTLFAVLAVSVFIVCCNYAREGVEWARVATLIEINVLLGLASLALLLAFVLMLVGCRENCTDDAGWWTQGQGQQFVAASFGWVVLALAGLSIRQREYLSSAVFLVIAVAMFGLWALLLEAGWSDRGPLAVVDAIAGLRG